MEIKASFPKAPRLVESRLEEQLRGTVIVGGDEEGSRLLWKHTGCAPPASAAPSPLGSPWGPTHWSQGAFYVLICSSEALPLTRAIKPFNIHLYFLDPFLYRNIFLRT